MPKRFFLVALLSLFVLPRVVAQPVDSASRQVMLPNGWSLSPHGTQLAVDDFPLNAAISPDEKTLAILHCGVSQPQLWLIDVKKFDTLQTVPLKDGWLGMAFQGDRLYVSGGNQNCVYRFQVSQNRLRLLDSIQLAAPSPKQYVSVAGVAVSGNTLAAVCRGDSTLRYVDLKSRKQDSIRLSGMPYQCKFLKNGVLLVSLWDSKKIQAFKKNRLLYEIACGDHPNEFVLSRQERYAFVACANDNTVTIADLQTKRVVANISTSLYPDSPEGSTTNSVALSPDEKFLLAANADNNSVTVIDIRAPRRAAPIGFIPTGWYPTKTLVLKNGTMLVLNGKGGRSMPNPKREYIGALLKGSMSKFTFPSDKELLDLTKQVYRNTPYNPRQLSEASFSGESIIPKKVGEKSPIKHVFYIIKENRTYDQVFGDMPEGNGDTSLCLFGERITPNQHKLAREYVLFDNFYVNAEVSADGHNWSTAAYATDYVEKIWPVLYGRRGGTYEFEGGFPVAIPKSGYLWDLCARHNVSFRSYGEFVINGKTPEKPVRASDKNLEGRVCPTYRGWDMNYSDTSRFHAWEKEFSTLEKTNAVPQFNLIRLGNNHTAGTRKGMLTPQAFVAQNDYAVGLFVERLSKSSIWKESAIFIVEDDAQNGADHIDAHRSTALVISPYTKRHFVDRTLYTTASMIRTMELLLGMPPMSQYDAAATPMFNAFATTPTLTSYSHETPRIDILEKNPDGAVGQLLMNELNLAREDAVPDRLFNEIVWEFIKGTKMPPPRYSIFSVGATHSRKDDDD